MLDAAYRRFKSCALKCLPLMMPAVLAAQAADIYWLLGGHRVTQLFEPRDPTFYALTIAGFAVYLWLSAAVVLRMQAVATGRLQPVAADLRTALQFWPALFSTSMLASLAVLVGLVALLVPGIYLMVCLTLLFPVVLLDRQPPVAAIRRCVALVRPQWVKVLAALLIGMGIMLICLFTVGIVLAMLMIPLGAGNAAAVNALGTTASLLVAALAQLFFLSLALQIHSSASASA